MSTPEPAPAGGAQDGCAELRTELTTRCREATAARAAHDAKAEEVRELKRDLTAARHQQTDAAAAADPRLRAAEKAAAHDAYQLARATATDEAGRVEATTVWARAVDDINRADRLARRAVSSASAAVSDLEAALREAEREEQTLRITAGQAEAACLEARVRLASCEEAASTTTTTADAAGAATVPEATVFEPHAATGGHAVSVGSDGMSPLVIESLVSGDAAVIGLAAARIAEHTELSPAEAQVRLQELVDAVVVAAASEGFLVFDTSYPLWAELSFEEARDVIAALARLGFVFDPTEGWQAGRVPAPHDLSMALGYAGLDTFGMRVLPDAAALAKLPHSIGVDARAFLVARAPELTIDQLAPILGPRAEQLGALWDAWGQVRPVLLREQRDLEADAV
jgi:hypothetical protein